MSDIGLRQINNAVFLHTTTENLVKLTMIKEYIAFGYPTKKIVNDLVRKRGFLKKDTKKLPITDNVLIEELLGGEDQEGCICIEDIIDSVYKCYQEDHLDNFKNIQNVMWPFQLGSL
jgi:large subunit ribosomal protein L7e